ncbi:MAG: RDD family protein [Armatimonadota bacterium]|jgi:uncharacterized RDD family membrane protein YckC
MQCPKCGCNNVDRVQSCWNCDAPLKVAETLKPPPKAGLAPGAAPPSAPEAEPAAAALQPQPDTVAATPAPVNPPMAGANPEFVRAQAEASRAAQSPPPPPGAALTAQSPAYAGAYGQQAAYGAAAPQAGALPPPPATYARVEAYVPTYRPPAEAVVAHAGFGWRLAAWALDTIILNVAGFIVGLPIGILAGVVGAANGMSEQDIGNTANYIAMPLSLLVCFLYCTVLLAWRGQTVGMMACSLKVVHTDGMPIGFGTAVVRWICYFIAAMPCGLGLLWMIWDPECQGWHDKLAGTYVVRIG